MNQFKLYLFLVLFTCVLQPARAANWVENSLMVVPRTLHTATRLLDGTVLVCGGETNWIGIAFTASAELYLPASNAWALTSTMTRSRSDHTATLLFDGGVLVCGGTGDVPDTEPTSLLASAEIYHPKQNGKGGSWTVVGSMNEARRGHSATLLPTGKVLVAGGQGAGNYPDILASAELFDPVRGAWVPAGSMNEVRYGHTATLLPNGKVLVAGGSPGNNETVSSAEVFDPETGVWSPVAAMQTDRQLHWATLLTDGRVLVVGGRQYTPTGGNNLRSTEIYDPASGDWQTSGNRLPFVAGSGVCLLPTGDVLAACGYGSGLTYPTNSEIYVTATGVWTNTSGCVAPRQDGTTTMLADGRILFAGGRWDFDVLDSSELFTSSTPVSPPQMLIAKMPAGGVQITFTNRPGALFQVLSNSNLQGQLDNWSIAGGAFELCPGWFRFTEPTLGSRRLYRLLSIP